MKTFLKTLIGGALGIGALYVVGKVCYEAGKDVAEIEHQLKENPVEKNDTDPAEETRGSEEPTEDSDAGNEERLGNTDNIDKIHARITEQLDKDIDEALERNTKPTAFGKMLDKVRNAKMFVRVKKSFERKGDRSPGILGSLLSNPDGARIEAFVKNGGVQINVTPKTT